MTAIAAFLLWIALWSPAARRVLEAEMALHMAVQLPLLVAVGVMLWPALRRFEPGWLAEANWQGIAGVVVAVFAAAFWMLPRSLDAALAGSGMEAAKLLSLPLLVGVPLAASWGRLPPLGRAFLLAQLISMLGALGALYVAAPIRVCAYYRVDQQVRTGESLLLAAAAVALLCFLRAFAGRAGRPGPRLIAVPTLAQTR